MKITLPILWLAALLTPSRVHAGMLTVPDLPAGSPYRLVFVTGEVIDATSADINTYNAFVNNQANNLAGYSGSVLAVLGTTWDAIASTATVSAFDNIGGSFNDPIYQADGTLVANGSSGLWSGSLLDASGIYIGQGGLPVGDREVWTGTRPDGSGQPTGELGVGRTNPSTFGYAYASDSNWISAGATRGTAGLRLYGISRELTVPTPTPEPSTLISILMGTTTLGLLHRRAGQRGRMST